MSLIDAPARLRKAFRWNKGHADFSDVLLDAELLRAIGPALAEPFARAEVSAVVAVEARGFLLAGLVAPVLGVGVVLARKPGAVQPDAERATSATPDWRGRHIELGVSRRAVQRGDRLLLVDDWIETGSQARTVRSLVIRMDATLIGVSVLVDDTTADVREDLNVVALVRSSELGPSAP